MEFANAPSRRGFALIGSYVPRRCGIATFTKDLHDALLGACDTPPNIAVLAMDDLPEGYDYPPEVRFQIQAHRRADYLTAAGLLNINNVEVLFVQHEFGIFGGGDGSYLLHLTNRLRMPIITTLHTVLSDPTPGQARVMLELAQASDRLVVMSEHGAEILNRAYEVPRERIAVIPHGIPDVPFVDTAFWKDQYGLEEHNVILTFGLLSSGKGVEYGIRALPKIHQRHPNVAYVVLGATHPHVLRRQGEAYRNSLERLAEGLGVAQNVVFHNRYVSLDELVGFICAADIYLTPYLGKDQIVSGTLAYAAGAGKAVVSTPYRYAEELLADGRGILVPFKDHDAIADAIVGMLDNDLERNAMRKRAYVHCRNMTWNEVGHRYLELVEEVLAERRHRPKAVFFHRAKYSLLDALPEADLRHLRAMTDTTGILQHAIYSVPDRRHGYCTDDNARALRAAILHFDLYEDESVLPLASTYLSFLHYAFNPETGRFRNFMGYDRRWLEDVGSEDCHGRTIRALGCAAAFAHNETIRNFAVELLHSALPALERMEHLRPLATSTIGLHAYLSRYPADRTVRRLRDEIAARMWRQFQSEISEDWPWPEDVATYDNAKLPHALILCGQWVPHGEMLDQGLRSLDWLVRKQTTNDGHISLIGNNGWMPRGCERARFDQQPIESMAMVEACAEAYRCTQDRVWLDRARNVFGWFLGHNDTQSVLYDFSTGGCRDGLQADGPNLNQGAESTLAWLIALLTLHNLNRDAADVKNAGVLTHDVKVASLAESQQDRNVSSS
ncbi:MAG: glycosyltransferase family 4 protein [Candidatus Hydrogenedentes bacterium]|nr:glycosyltransferase family 4 protein [Candidatus Hydrogenedentota bacterium]